MNSLPQILELRCESMSDSRQTASHEMGGHGTWQETLQGGGGPMGLWVRDEGGGDRQAGPTWGYEAQSESKEAGAKLVQSGPPAEAGSGGAGMPGGQGERGWDRDLKRKASQT